MTELSPMGTRARPATSDASHRPPLTFSPPSSPLRRGHAGHGALAALSLSPSAKEVKDEWTVARSRAISDTSNPNNSNTRQKNRRGSDLAQEELRARLQDSAILTQHGTRAVKALSRSSDDGEQSPSPPASPWKNARSHTTIRVDALTDSKELTNLAENSSPIPSRRRSISHSQAHSPSVIDREQRTSIMEGQQLVDADQEQTQLQPLRISRWTLRFSDQRMEEAFRHHFTRDLLRSFRWMALVCALQHLVVGVIEVATDTTGDVQGEIIIGRAAIIFIMMIAIIVTFTSEWWSTRLSKLVIVSNAIQSIILIVTFAFAAYDNDEPHHLTLYAPSAGQLATAFALVFFGFVQLGSGMLVLHSVPLCLAHIIVSDIVAILLDINWWAIGQSTVIQFGFMVLCWWTTYTIEKQKRRELLLLLSVSNDRQRRNDLVNSMLPKAVVARLRAQQPAHRRTSTAGMALQRHVSENFDSVSVLFMYVSTFKDLVYSLDHQRLVATLNELYSSLDELTIQFPGLYKMEAIAETYMVTSGCPQLNPYHAGTLAEYALGMVECVRQLQDQGHAQGVRIQIGIHSGPVAAGVVGIKTFSYHLFGDTVNTASRMCSLGQPEKVQVSERTALMIEQEFVTRPHPSGPIAVKGKGMMQTYFVESKRESTPSRRVAQTTGNDGDDDNALNFVAEFPASPYTLRLHDKGLEKEFGFTFADASGHFLKISIPSVIAMCLLYLTANAVNQGQNPDYFIPQYASVVVILAGLLVYSRTRWFIQTHQTAIGVVCIVVLCAINLTPLYNTQQVTDLSQTAYKDRGFLLANFNIIAIMALFFMMRLQFRVAIMVATCSIVFLCAMLAVAAGDLTRIIMMISIVVVCTLITAYAQYRQERTMRFDFLLEQVLHHERRMLYRLLLNMLPSGAHAELLMCGQQVVEEQHSVTLLQSDIRGFTNQAAKMDAAMVCLFLNELFTAFDEHLEERGVYKIDTIGDAFVVVGGISGTNAATNHAQAICDFALDMLYEIERVKNDWNMKNRYTQTEPMDISMRIGVHSGKVIAATVGLIRPRYLLFGQDTIIAGKMESEGEEGKIQISQTTYDLMSGANSHLLVPRGSMKLPFGRVMDTYWCRGRVMDLLKAARDKFEIDKLEKLRRGELKNESEITLGLAQRPSFSMTPSPPSHSGSGHSSLHSSGLSSSGDHRASFSRPSGMTTDSPNQEQINAAYGGLPWPKIRHNGSNRDLMTAAMAAASPSSTGVSPPISPRTPTPPSSSGTPPQDTKSLTGTPPGQVGRSSSGGRRRIRPQHDGGGLTNSSPSDTDSSRGSGNNIMPSSASSSSANIRRTHGRGGSTSSSGSQASSGGSGSPHTSPGTSPETGSNHGGSRPPSANGTRRRRPHTNGAGAGTPGTRRRRHGRPRPTHGGAPPPASSAGSNGSTSLLTSIRQAPEHASSLWTTHQYHNNNNSHLMMTSPSLVMTSMGGLPTIPGSPSTPAHYNSAGRISTLHFDGLPTPMSAQGQGPLTGGGPFTASSALNTSASGSIILNFGSGSGSGSGIGLGLGIPSPVVGPATPLRQPSPSPLLQPSNGFPILSIMTGDSNTNAGNISQIPPIPSPHITPIPQASPTVSGTRLVSPRRSLPHIPVLDPPPSTHSRRSLTPTSLEPPVSLFQPSTGSPSSSNQQSSSGSLISTSVHASRSPSPATPVTPTQPTTPTRLTNHMDPSQANFATAARPPLPRRSVSLPEQSPPNANGRGSGGNSGIGLLPSVSPTIMHHLTAPPNLPSPSPSPHAAHLGGLGTSVAPSTYPWPASDLLGPIEHTLGAHHHVPGAWANEPPLDPSSSASRPGSGFFTASEPQSRGSGGSNGSGGFTFASGTSPYMTSDSSPVSQSLVPSTDHSPHSSGSGSNGSPAVPPQISPLLLAATLQQQVAALQAATAATMTANNGQHQQHQQQHAMTTMMSGTMMTTPVPSTLPNNTPPMSLPVSHSTTPLGTTPPSPSRSSVTTQIIISPMTLPLPAPYMDGSQNPPSPLPPSTTSPTTSSTVGATVSTTVAAASPSPSPIAGPSLSIMTNSPAMNASPQMISSIMMTTPSPQPQPNASPSSASGSGLSLVPVPTTPAGGSSATLNLSSVASSPIAAPLSEPGGMAPTPRGSPPRPQRSSLILNRSPKSAPGGRIRAGSAATLPSGFPSAAAAAAASGYPVLASYAPLRPYTTPPRLPSPSPTSAGTGTVGGATQTSPTLSSTHVTAVVAFPPSTPLAAGTIAIANTMTEPNSPLLVNTPSPNSFSSSPSMMASSVAPSITTTTPVAIQPQLPAMSPSPSLATSGMDSGALPSPVTPSRRLSAAIRPIVAAPTSSSMSVTISPASANGAGNTGSSGNATGKRSSQTMGTPIGLSNVGIDLPSPSSPHHQLATSVQLGSLALRRMSLSLRRISTTSLEVVQVEQSASLDDSQIERFHKAAQGVDLPPLSSFAQHLNLPGLQPLGLKRGQSEPPTPAAMASAASSRRPSLRRPLSLQPPSPAANQSTTPTIHSRHHSQGSNGSGPGSKRGSVSFAGDLVPPMQFPPSTMMSPGRIERLPTLMITPPVGQHSQGSTGSHSPAEGYSPHPSLLLTIPSNGSQSNLVSASVPTTPRGTTSTRRLAPSAKQPSTAGNSRMASRRQSIDDINLHVKQLRHDSERQLEGRQNRQQLLAAEMQERISLLQAEAARLQRTMDLLTQANLATAAAVAAAAHAQIPIPPTIAVPISLTSTGSNNVAGTGGGAGGYHGRHGSHGSSHSSGRGSGHLSDNSPPKNDWSPDSPSSNRDLLVGTRRASDTRPPDHRQQHGGNGDRHDEHDDEEYSDEYDDDDVEGDDFEGDEYDDDDYDDDDHPESAPAAAPQRSTPPQGAPVSAVASPGMGSGVSTRVASSSPREYHHHQQPSSSSSSSHHHHHDRSRSNSGGGHGLSIDSRAPSSSISSTTSSAAPSVHRRSIDDALPSKSPMLTISISEGGEARAYPLAMMPMPPMNRTQSLQTPQQTGHQRQPSSGISNALALPETKRMMPVSPRSSGAVIAMPLSPRGGGDHSGFGHQHYPGAHKPSLASLASSALELAPFSPRGGITAGRSGRTPGGGNSGGGVSFATSVTTIGTSMGSTGTSFGSGNHSYASSGSRSPGGGLSSASSSPTQAGSGPQSAQASRETATGSGTNGGSWDASVPERRMRSRSRSALEIRFQMQPQSSVRTRALGKGLF